MSHFWPLCHLYVNVVFHLSLEAGVELQCDYISNLINNDRDNRAQLAFVFISPLSMLVTFASQREQFTATHELSDKMGGAGRGGGEELKTLRRNVKIF